MIQRFSADEFLPINAMLGPWKLNPRQLAKKRKEERKRAEFQARREASKPTGEIDPNASWGVPSEPKSATPKVQPNWEDDSFNKSQRKNPAQ